MKVKRERLLIYIRMVWIGASISLLSPLATFASEIETIFSTPQVISWAYFRDPSQTTFSKWYLASPLGVTNALGKNNSGHAAWVSIANGAKVSNINFSNNSISVNASAGSLTPTDRYWTVPQVRTDNAEYVYGNSANQWANLIAGQTINLDWYFFRVESTQTWYIVKAAGNDATILRMELNAAKYDFVWQQPLDRCGAAVDTSDASKWTKTISQENGVWKVSFNTSYAPSCPTDITPPQTTVPPSVTVTSGNTAMLSVAVNKNATGYYLALPNPNTAPTAATVMLAGIPFSMTANITSTIDIFGLSPLTAYTLYFVAKDAADNVQPQVQNAAFTTTNALPAGYLTQGGLTWMKVGFTKSWSDASNYCATTINGQTGWRMPTKDELINLYNSNLMAGMGWFLFPTWSSTPDIPGSHYFVNLDGGTVDIDGDAMGNAVSCVHAPDNIMTLKWPLPTAKPATPVVGGAFGDYWGLGQKYCKGLPMTHTGVDIPASKGTIVYAAYDGTVKEILSATQTAEWASAIVIEHTLQSGNSTKFTTVYWHVIPTVTVGDLVSTGMQIATVADLTQYNNTTHFHFGVRIGSYDGTYSDKGALPTGYCSQLSTFKENFIDPWDIRSVIFQ